MDNARRLIIFLVAICGIAGCDDSFNPDGPFDRKLVVYAVLSDRNDTQYVRVYASYPPMSDPSYVPSDNQVTDAEVSIARGATIYRFHDTIVPRSGLSSYASQIRLNVAYRFPMAQAARYVLTVNSPTWGSVSASLISLYSGRMYLQNAGSLADPNPATAFTVSIAPGVNIAAYIVRAFLDYEVRGAAPQTHGRMEIPIALQTGTTGPDSYIYPTPIRRGGAPVPDSPGNEMVVFSAEAGRAAIDGLRGQYPGDTIQFTRAVVSLTQMDSVLYSYYNVLHGFPGSGSLRLDEPDFGNIRGGLGIFASTTVDSVVLPISTPSNRPAASSATHPHDLLDPRK